MRRGPLPPVVASLLALLAIGSSPATAQVPNDTSVKAYLELLSRYEHGEHEAVAREASRLEVATARALTVRVFDDIEIEMARPQNRDPATQDRLRAERLRLLTLTLLVHTEVAVRLNAPEPLLGQLSLLDDVVDRLGDLERDFRAKGWSDMRDTAPSERRSAGERQWDAVWQLIRQWHLVVISHLQRMGNGELLKKHVGIALQSFRDDPELLLAHGTALEMEADAKMIDRSMARLIYTSDFMQQWRESMRAAGGDYRNAVRRRPELHEAWLRLGRTKAHLGDRDEARRVLTQVAQKAPVAMRYLAYLFLAELAEQQHLLADAISAYQSALALLPTAQAPLLSLSRLSDASGDSGSALKWLARSVNAIGPGRPEPWWEYQLGQSWMLEGRLAQLRLMGLGR